MISIGSKNKVLLFDVSTKGIASENLEFWFRIHNENVSYSFKGELLEKDKVKIVVLPLTEMVNNKYLDSSKIYPAKLEVIGDGKYSLVPWEGEIKLEASPKIDVKLENVIEEIKKIDTKPKKESKSKDFIEEVKEPASVKVNMSEIIEEDVEENKKNVTTIKENKDQDKLDDYTRTSLLEDILGSSKKKPNVMTKINKLIKE